MLSSSVFVYTELRSANQNPCRFASRTPAALRPPHFRHRQRKHATAIPLVSNNYKCPLAQLLSLHILTNAPGVWGAVLPFLKLYLNSFAKSSFITCPSPLSSPFTFMRLRTLSFFVSCKSFACLPAVAAHSYENFASRTVLRDENCRVSPNISHFGTLRLSRAMRWLSSHQSQSRITSHVPPLLHYPLHFGGTACRPATMHGNCFASTPLPKACANTCWPSKPASAPTRAKPAPTRKPGASPRCFTISITSAGPTTNTPPIRGIPPKARRFCASRATPRKSSAPFSLTRITATFLANPRWSTRFSPATNSPAFSRLAPTSVRPKAFSISRWIP